MRPTFFLPAGFQLAATVMLAIVPVIFAIPSPELLSPKTIQFRDLVPPSFDGDLTPGLGCFKDDNDLPTLTSLFFSDPKMTPLHCGVHCDSLYYDLFGVVNGLNCRCGNVTAAYTTPVSPALCNIPCPGSSTQKCGGKNTIAIYGHSQPPATIIQHVGPWTFSGCFNDNDNAKTLAVPQSVLGGQHNNTVENCVNACGPAGYKYAGVGNRGGKYCWCDNQINQGKTPLLDSSSCMTPCPGDNRELCGGLDSLVIYKT